MTEIEFDFGPFNKSVAYTYDAVGNRATMVDAENGTTTYVWDALNRLTSMTAPGNLTFAFAYDASSRRTKLMYPNGMYTNTTYNDADWVTLIESRWANHTIIESFSYAYDDVGNRVNVTYENGTSVRYAYDEVYRLTEENYSWGLVIAYTYDGTGNRLTETRNGVVTNYTYDAEDHLLTRGNVTYEWDENGNLVKKVAWDGNTTYGWDYENRLVNVTRTDGTVLAYAYSVWNDRMSESVENETTYLFYDFHDLTGAFADLIGTYDSDGSRTDSYVSGPGADEPLRDTTSYHLRDALGSTTARVGDLTTTHRYEAFGGSIGSPPARYGFTSRELDGVTSLYFYRARWYDLEIGRFLSKDPIGIADGPNLYAYVRNNPINVDDPSGLAHWFWCMLLCTRSIPIQDLYWNCYWDCLARRPPNMEYEYAARLCRESCLTAVLLYCCARCGLEPCPV